MSSRTRATGACGRRTATGTKDAPVTLNTDARSVRQHAVGEPGTARPQEVSTNKPLSPVSVLRKFAMFVLATQFRSVKPLARSSCGASWRPVSCVSPRGVSEPQRTVTGPADADQATSFCSRRRCRRALSMRLTMPGKQARRLRLGNRPSPWESAAVNRTQLRTRPSMLRPRRLAVAGRHR